MNIKFNIKKVLIMVTLVTGLLLFSTACGSENVSLPNTNNTQSATGILADNDIEVSLEGYGSNGALSDENLTISDMLIYAAKDEYLAHNEYEQIIKKFGSKNPYSNIIKAEENHLAALKDIYSSYDMTFPEDNSDKYVIVPDNLLDAAKTGVQAELNNIAMYDTFLKQQLPDDIREVFTSLRDASKSHLAAFQKQVDKLS